MDLKNQQISEKDSTIFKMEEKIKQLDAQISDLQK